jgi:hypothetical protein
MDEVPHEGQASYFAAAIALLDRSVVLGAVEEETARTSEPFEVCC